VALGDHMSYPVLQRACTKFGCADEHDDLIPGGGGSDIGVW
jgi:hypothetical protein